jgi:uncharacterized protein (DUF433 family)
MLNPSRLKVYLNAYIIRMRKGETEEEINKDYKELGRLTDEDITQIHESLTKKILGMP